MIPICRESGLVVAFGGRAMEADQVPKYLNSPETPIYSKGRTLYGLNVTKTAIRQQGRARMVEGYFDFAHGIQGGVTAVVAELRHGADAAAGAAAAPLRLEVVLSFDPDAAGQGAAVRSCDLLVARGLRGQRRAAAGGTRSRPGRARGRRRGVSGDRRPGAAVSRLPRRPRGEAARHGDAGRPPRLPERRCWRWPPRSRRPRPAISSRIGCRCGPASARTSVRAGDSQGGGGAQDHRRDAAPGVAAQLTEAERDLLTQPDVDAGRGRRRGGRRSSRPTWSGWRRRALLESAQALARDERDPGTVRIGRLPAPLGAGRGRRGLPDRPVGAGREAGAGGRLHSGAQGAPGERERQEIQRQIDAFQQAGRRRRRRRRRRLLARKMREARAAQAEG